MRQAFLTYAGDPAGLPGPSMQPRRAQPDNNAARLLQPSSSLLLLTDN